MKLAHTLILSIALLAAASAAEAKEWVIPPGTAAKELANDPLPKKNLPLAIKSGVKIAYGTDPAAR